MSPERELVATAGSGEGQRLDVFVAERVPEQTRAQIQKLIGSARIKVNGQAQKASFRLRPGDRITVAYEPAPRSQGLPAEDIPLAILHADSHIVVLNKPAGLVVHPGAGHKSGTLANALVHHFPELRLVGQEDRPGIVHRLDKETSGLMVVARSWLAYAALQAAFKARRVEKTYLGLIWGRMPRPEGEFTWAIGRHVRHGQRISVKTRRPREAETRYKVLKEFREFSLLEIKPVTGRTHQIRVHLAAAGHPLAGDVLYGRRKSRVKMPRLFLHARRLRFPHPVSGATLDFITPLPPDLDDVLKRLE